jgi:hypothetical protein
MRLGLIGSIVPLGRDYFPRESRHLVPGYYQPVPPGQKPFTPRAPHVKLTQVFFFGRPENLAINLLADVLLPTARKSRIRAIVHLERNFMVDVGIQQRHRVIQDGPFAVLSDVRHAPVRQSRDSTDEFSVAVTGEYNQGCARGKNCLNSRRDLIPCGKMYFLQQVIC